MADIVRMVEAAQARTAPIQRLADSVAGRFAYGVMGASLATFVFWATAGTSMFPQVGLFAKQSICVECMAYQKQGMVLVAGPIAPRSWLTRQLTIIIIFQTGAGRQGVPRRIAPAQLSNGCQRAGSGLPLCTGPCCTHCRPCGHQCGRPKV